MIILVTGEFGVGKDLFADELEKQLRMYSKKRVKKILSYTTRPKRYPEENTHTFISKEEWEQIKKQDTLIAETIIDNEYYGTVASQFNNDINIYIVDKKGIQDVFLSILNDEIEIVEITRPRTLRTISTTRLNRKESPHFLTITSDIIINNDSTKTSFCEKISEYAHTLIE